MNNQPLSHDDATALIAGSLPPDRPDLVALAAAIDDLRDAFAEPAPQPSPELADWLTGAQPPALHATESTATPHTPVRTHTGARRRIWATARALAALGVTAKIFLGGTAALAAIASAGAVGVLPQAPQAVFDRILHNHHADPPLPGTPPNGAPGTSTGHGARPDASSGAQRHTQQPATKLSTSEPQDRDSDDRSQDATTDPPRGGSDPAPDQDETDDPDEAKRERLEDPDDGSDDEEDHDSDDEYDEEPDHEPDEEPDHDSDDEFHDEDDRSHVEETVENDDSADAEDLDAETSDG